jgi:predicted DNA-binding transcriptional regulator AlpA
VLSLGMGACCTAAVWVVRASLLVVAACVRLVGFALVLSSGVVLSGDLVGVVVCGFGVSSVVVLVVVLVVPFLTPSRAVLLILIRTAVLSGSIERFPKRVRCGGVAVRWSKEGVGNAVSCAGGGDSSGSCVGEGAGLETGE